MFTIVPIVVRNNVAHSVCIRGVSGMYRGGAYGRWWAGQAAVAKRPSRDAVTTGGVTEADPGPGGAEHVHTVT